MLSEHAFTHMLLLNTDFDVIRQQERITNDIIWSM